MRLERVLQAFFAFLFTNASLYAEDFICRRSHSSYSQTSLKKLLIRVSYVTFIQQNIARLQTRLRGSIKIMMSESTAEFFVVLNFFRKIAVELAYFYDNVLVFLKLLKFTLEEKLRVNFYANRLHATLKFYNFFFAGICSEISP